MEHDGPFNTVAIHPLDGLINAVFPAVNESDVSVNIDDVLEFHFSSPLFLSKIAVRADT